MIPVFHSVYEERFCFVLVIMIPIFYMNIHILYYA